MCSLGQVVTIREGADHLDLQTGNVFPGIGQREEAGGGTGKEAEGGGRSEGQTQGCGCSPLSIWISTS